MAVAAAALTALVAFAAGSGPGDPLYGVKRGTEQAQLALAGHWRRGPILLDLAGTRLAELRGLAVRSSPDQTLMLRTLQTMDGETADGTSWLAARALATHSAAPLDQLVRWRSGQSDALVALRPQLPTTVSSAVDHSLAVSPTRALGRRPAPHASSRRAPRTRPPTRCAGAPRG